MTTGYRGPAVAALIVVAGLAVPAVAGGRVYVSAGAAPGGDGRSWSTALLDLHDALALAAAPESETDEIWVAAGTYRPAGPDGDQTVSFVLTGGVALYGGFAGDETELEQRDWVANETILSGDLNGDDLPEFMNYEDNSEHVLRCEGQAEPVVIDGFTVRGGSARSSPSENRAQGGGLLSIDSTVHCSHCSFFENEATNTRSWSTEGGAIHSAGGELVVCDSVFWQNRVFGYEATGGAVHSRDGSTVIDACSFWVNDVSAPGRGSACASLDSITMLTDSIFLGNGGSSVYTGPATAPSTEAL